MTDALEIAKEAKDFPQPNKYPPQWKEHLILADAVIKLTEEINQSMEPLELFAGEFSISQCNDNSFWFCRQGGESMEISEKTMEKIFK